MGFFGKLFGALKKAKAGRSEKLRVLFSKNKLGDEFYEELEEILIMGDLGVETTMSIIERLQEEVKEKKGKKIEYTVNYAMKGLNVCQTPLTEEEKAYTKHDVKKIMGKLPEQDNLFDKLLPEYQELINDGSDNESFSEELEEPKKTLPSKSIQTVIENSEEFVSESESDYDDDEDVPF